MRLIVSTCVQPLMAPYPLSAADGGHGGPTPICRKGCKPLSPEQLRYMHQRSVQPPPSIGRDG